MYANSKIIVALRTKALLHSFYKPLQFKSAVQSQSVHQSKVILTIKINTV